MIAHGPRKKFWLPSIAPLYGAAAGGGGGGTPYTHVQSQVAGPASGAGVAFASNNTAGNMIIVCAAINATGVPTISDTRGNTYGSPALAVNNGARGIVIWVAFGIAGGTNTVTLTLAGQTMDVTLAEYSGLSSVDKTSSGFNTSTNPTTSATATTTQGNEMVFGFAFGNGAQPTAGAGFTSRVTGAPVNFFVINEDLRVTATGAQTATFVSTNQTWVAGCVTFKETGG